ncbi:MAG: hypothetical protein JJE13_03255 [Thermoleophilia bacterium]|nr:hypothetical protein [Thermoleophilia bacterium]
MSDPVETTDETAEMVVTALEDYQQLSIAVVTNNADDPEAAIKGLVALHLNWTEDNRETAKLVARHRNAAAAGPLGERLMASNREFFASMRTWIDRQSESGRLPPISFNLMHAVTFAPTQEVAKLSLAGRLKKPLPEYAEALGDAAWAGLLALPERRRDPVGQ